MASDPTIYLTNSSRLALGLVGTSDAPQSVVQAAQDAYFKANGSWLYVASMPNKASSTPKPDPTPEPEPEAGGETTKTGSKK